MRKRESGHRFASLRSMVVALHLQLFFKKTLTTATSSSGSIKSAKENAPLTSAAALLATALLLAPRPRAALWRATFGRFRSPEAARAAAASRAAAAAEEAGLVSKEAAGAWAAAEEALARLGEAKVDVATQARELRSLAARAEIGRAHV